MHGQLAVRLPGKLGSPLAELLDGGVRVANVFRQCLLVIEKLPDSPDLKVNELVGIVAGSKKRQDSADLGRFSGETDGLFLNHQHVDVRSRLFCFDCSRQSSDATANYQQISCDNFAELFQCSQSLFLLVLE